MRLIDADELEKKWTISSPESYNTDAVEVLDSIRNVATVDAIQMVRCKECKYYEECTSLLFGDDYCSLGKHKIRTKRTEKGVNDT